MAIFEVPQFIDVEDKVVGPLTLKQFGILAITAGIVYFIFKTFTFFIFVLFGGSVGLLGFAMAFLKINNQPLYKVAFNGLKFLIKPRLYVWQRETKRRELVVSKPEIVEEEKKERLTLEEIKRLAEKLDK
jgi:hypothetical protein